MIKYVVISRLSDGTVFCQINEDYHNNDLQNIKLKVKNYHKQVTPHKTSNKASSQTQIHQIDNSQNKLYQIFYKISSYVVFSIIVEHGYPIKLVSIFLDAISSSFFDEAKTILGAKDYQSRLQSIQGSHYFVKFDRIIKQKKKQFDDPQSMKNSERMKKQIQSIQNIMKENLNMLDQRGKDLQRTQQKARICTDEAKNFEKNTKKLKWQLWFKKNLIWIVLVVTIVVLGWIIV